MKRIFLTITIFSILAILPLVIFAQSAEKPFAGCEFIVEDTACSQYLGKTQAEIESMLGKPDKNSGDYYRLGTWFFFVRHKKDNVYRASKILFHGDSKDSYYSPFAGKPARNLNWNAKMDEVIKKYGNPVSKTDLGNSVTLKYGKIEFSFDDNRLKRIRLKDVEGEKLRQIANKQFDEQKLQNALKDCKFILDDNGCGKYFGKSEKEISDLFGIQLKNNNYPELGLFFYIWGDPKNNVPMTVAEVTFYNEGKNVKQFYGQPGENLSWNATRDDVINQYGKPTEETKWLESDNIPRSDLNYGETLRITIENNRIKKITIISPTHNKDVDAYFRRLKEEKEGRDKEYADHLARQREKDRIRDTTASSSANSSNSSQPVVSAEIKEAFDSLHLRVESINEQANKKVEEFNKSQGWYEAMGWRYKKEREISNIRGKAVDLIDKFLKDYKGKLPKEMIDHLEGDIRKILLGERH